MLRKHLSGATVIIVAVALTVGLAACGGSKAAPTTTPDTTPITEPPTTPVPTTLVPPPRYPGSVPAGKCSAKLVSAQTGMNLVSPVLRCRGPWFIDEGPAQPASSKSKKTVTVYRWTGTTWQNRGQVPFECTNDAVPAGMSTRYANLFGATLKGAANGCNPGPSSVPEPATGPLSPGATGERVRALQNVLIAANLLRGTADGMYGSGTRAAIYDYQFLNNLSPTGIADEALLATFAGYAVPVTPTTDAPPTSNAVVSTTTGPATTAN